MKPSTLGKVSDDVFRDKIEEDRGSYFVEYQPATSAIGLALINLTFPANGIDLKNVCQAMEKELLHWLERFPVPTMVSSFNATDDLLNLESVSANSHIMGYIDPESHSVQWRWGLYKYDELPKEQLTEAYFRGIYKSVPFRTKAEVHDLAERKGRMRKYLFLLSFFFAVLVPLAFEIVFQAAGLVFGWIGVIGATIAIIVSFLKIGKACGWIKRSQREIGEAEKLRKMKHYYLHCEANPEGFNRLKFENFDKDIIKKNSEQAERIRSKIKIE